MSCLGARGGALQQANKIQQGETPTADNSDLSSLITENSNLKFGFEMIQTQCQNLQCSSANCSVVPTLCDPTEYSVHGILQARILEWEPLPCPGRSSPPRDWTQVSRTAGEFFTIWATGEALMCRYSVQRSFGRSLFQILLPVLIWTGGLLNLLPSYHLDIFLQLHPPCVFFFFPLWLSLYWKPFFLEPT